MVDTVLEVRLNGEEAGKEFGSFSDARKFFGDHKYKYRQAGEGCVEFWIDDKMKERFDAADAKALISPAAGKAKRAKKSATVQKQVAIVDKEDKPAKKTAKKPEKKAKQIGMLDGKEVIKPKSAYMIYSAGMREAIKQELENESGDGKIDQKEIMRRIGANWKALEDKGEWTVQAEAEKTRYDEEMKKADLVDAPPKGSKRKGGSKVNSDKENAASAGAAKSPAANAQSKSRAGQVALVDGVKVKPAMSAYTIFSNAKRDEARSELQKLLDEKFEADSAKVEKDADVPAAGKEENKEAETETAETKEAAEPEAKSAEMKVDNTDSKGQESTKDGQESTKASAKPAESKKPPAVAQSDVMKRLAELWKGLSESGKQEWDMLSKADQERHQKQLEQAEWVPKGEYQRREAEHKERGKREKERKRLMDAALPDGWKREVGNVGPAAGADAADSAAAADVDAIAETCVVFVSPMGKRCHTLAEMKRMQASEARLGKGQQALTGFFTPQPKKKKQKSFRAAPPLPAAKDSPSLAKKEDTMAAAQPSCNIAAKSTTAAGAGGVKRKGNALAAMIARAKAKKSKRNSNTKPPSEESEQSEQGQIETEAKTETTNEAKAAAAEAECVTPTDTNTNTNTNANANANANANDDSNKNCTAEWIAKGEQIAELAESFPDWRQQLDVISAKPAAALEAAAAEMRAMPRSPAMDFVVAFTAHCLALATGTNAEEDKGKEQEEEQKEEQKEKEEGVGEEGEEEGAPASKQSMPMEVDEVDWVAEAQVVEGLEATFPDWREQLDFIKKQSAEQLREALAQMESVREQMGAPLAFLIRYTSHILGVLTGVEDVVVDKEEKEEKEGKEEKEEKKEEEKEEEEEKLEKKAEDKEDEAEEQEFEFGMDTSATKAGEAEEATGEETSAEAKAVAKVEEDAEAEAEAEVEEETSPEPTSKKPLTMWEQRMAKKRKAGGTQGDGLFGWKKGKGEAEADEKDRADAGGVENGKKKGKAASKNQEQTQKETPAAGSQKESNGGEVAEAEAEAEEEALELVEEYWEDREAVEEDWLKRWVKKAAKIATDLERGACVDWCNELYLLATCPLEVMQQRKAQLAHAGALKKRKSLRAPYEFMVTFMNYAIRKKKQRIASRPVAEVVAEEVEAETAQQAMELEKGGVAGGEGSSSTTASEGAAAAASDARTRQQQEEDEDEDNADDFMFETMEASGMVETSQQIKAAGVSYEALKEAYEMGSTTKTMKKAGVKLSTDDKKKLKKIIEKLIDREMLSASRD